MIDFEHPEDEVYFKSILLDDFCKDINKFQNMFDFRIPEIKRKEFNKIRNQKLESLKAQFGIRCMLSLDVCDLESGIAVDHLIPISSNILNKEIRRLKAEKGKKVKTQSFGSNHLDNLVIACSNCNNRKKHKMLEHYKMSLILKEKRVVGNK